MVIQEENTNDSLLSKTYSIPATDDTNILINSYDARKPYGKASNSAGGFHQSKKDGRMCTYCNKSCHTVEVCYRKHGFPPSFDKK